MTPIIKAVLIGTVKENFQDLVEFMSTIVDFFWKPSLSTENTVFLLPSSIL